MTQRSTRQVLLDGFKLTEPRYYTVRNIDGYERPTVNVINVAHPEVKTTMYQASGRDHVKGVKEPYGTPQEVTHREQEPPTVWPRPMLTRYNGDNTWRVVQGGTTRATGFDTQADAQGWIDEQRR